MTTTAAPVDRYTPEELALISDDFELFCRIVVKIRTETGELKPFILNEAQLTLHSQLEEQLATEGMVRAIVPKGRQMGVSTYVAARYFWKTTLNKGQSCLIMAHKDDATRDLFTLVKRCHENAPPQFQPATSAKSANELAFTTLDSKYKVATAGGTEVARGSTNQLAHLSEFAWWPVAHASNNYTALMQSIPNVPGTEIIIESTAAGPGDQFHGVWNGALEGSNNFKPVFVPWFLMSKYRTEPPADWQPSEAWLDYEEQNGLDRDQTYWAYRKSAQSATANGEDTEAPASKFNQEYPDTAETAFMAAGDDLLRVFPVNWVRQAQARHKRNSDKKLYAQSGIGLDPAGEGADKTALVTMHGPRVVRVETTGSANSSDSSKLASWTAQFRRDDALICIDNTGAWGAGGLSFLKKHMNVDAKGINFSDRGNGTAREGGHQFKNKRAELHWRLREALHPEEGEDLELPDDKALIAEMLAVQFEYDLQGRITIESKKDLRKKLSRSPDRLDALLLAFEAARRQSKRWARKSGSMPTRATGGRTNIKGHRSRPKSHYPDGAGSQRPSRRRVFGARN